MKRVGLHLRLSDSFLSVAHQAIAYVLPFFQTFLFVKKNNRPIIPSYKEVHLFRTLCEQYFTQLFAHGSFWLNLSHTKKHAITALKYELMCAKKLGFTHLVTHAGYAQGARTKAEGIQALACTINKAMYYERDVLLVLENTAHGNLSVGSDLLDFVALRLQLDFPERVLFCLDTAHAHAYGYSINSLEEVNSFIRFFDEILGLKSLALIHLNDTGEKHGSQIDRHALLGEGVVGIMALQRFVMHESLLQVPLILELPTVEVDAATRALNLARAWCTR